MGAAGDVVGAIAREQDLGAEQGAQGPGVGRASELGRAGGAGGGRAPAGARARRSGSPRRRGGRNGWGSGSGRRDGSWRASGQAPVGFAAGGLSACSPPGCPPATGRQPAIARDESPSGDWTHDDGVAGAGRVALAHQPARRPRRPHEVPQVRDRAHVAGLAGVDRRDRDPPEGPAAPQADGDHLDLELEARLVALERRGHEAPAQEPVARLVVRDRLADGPRERGGAEGVRQPADRRHAREVAAADDELRPRPGRPGRREGGDEPRDLVRVVLPVRVERDDRVPPLVEARGGTRPGARRPCPGWAPGGAPARRPPRPGPPCRRSSRRRRPAPGGGGRRPATTAPIRGPSS